MAEVRDIRALYLKPGPRADEKEIFAWQKRVFKNRAGKFLVKSGRGIVAGVLAIRGASDVVVNLYDAADPNLSLGENELAVAVGVTGVSGSMDGFVNLPVEFQRGIIVEIPTNDMTVTVLYS
jgi:hypothetical protein